MLFNALFGLLLILSAYSSTIDPIDIVYPAFLGLAYPFILLANILFIVLWLSIKKKFVLLSLISIIISFPALSDFFQVNGSSEDENSIKVMSYNVRLFDLYNWSENKSTRDKIFDQLISQNADIYCFQEFYYTDQKGKFETRDTILTFLDAKHYKEAYTHKMRGGQYFGIATFSQYPIINSGEIKFDNDINNICLFVDLKKNKDTIRVYNLHIASIRFAYDDYKFVEDIDSKSQADELEEGALRIYQRLASAFKKRSIQSKKILEHVEQSPYPVILCGDFNDSPNSFCYQQFSHVLTDSFKESGTGIGNTYIGSFPSFRIDYIFHSQDYESINYYTLPNKYSDHHAIVSEIIFK
jgi:endonuclease/exonuclease/phosphatase family metal-dependent hydrolase